MRRARMQRSRASQSEFSAGGDGEAELRLEPEVVSERGEAEIELGPRGERDRRRDRDPHAATGVQRYREPGHAVFGKSHDPDADAAVQERTHLVVAADEVAHVRRDLDVIAVGEAVVADEVVAAIAKARRIAAAERERGDPVEP